MNNKRVFNNISALCEGFTEYFVNLVNAKKQPVNIALSGGSTPVALFQYWAHSMVNDDLWQKINFFWVDERCVKPNSEESNFFNAKVHLFDNLLINTTQIHRIKGEESPDLEATRYALTVQNEVPLHHNVPMFDLIILGMGDDGHTASIFPHQFKLWSAEQYFVVSQHPATGQQRISMTGRVINNAHHVAFVVTGKNKNEMVASVLNDHQETRENIPAAWVNPLSGNLFWFLDYEAASLTLHE